MQAACFCAQPGGGTGKRRCREHKQSGSVWHRTVECLHAGRLAPTSTHGTAHNGGHCVRDTAGSAFSSVAMNNTAALRDFSLPLFLEFSQEGLDMSKGSKNLREWYARLGCIPNTSQSHPELLKEHVVRDSETHAFLEA